MRHPFLRLIGKELRQSAAVTLATAGLMGLGLFVLGYLWAYYQPIPGALETLRILSLMPLLVLPFWIVWRALASWKSEWDGNHIPLLFMLPVPGWWLVLAKTIARVVESTVCALVAVGGALILNWSSMAIPGKGRGLLNDEPIPVFLYFSLVICLVVVAQFAGLAGKLVNRFGGWLSAVTLLTAGWGTIRFGGFAAPLLGWIPPWPVRFCNAQYRWQMCHWTWHLYRTPAVLGALLAVVLLLWLSGWLIDRHLEA